MKSTIGDVKLLDEGNHSRACRPLTYPKDVENQLDAWIHEIQLQILRGRWLLHAYC